MTTQANFATLGERVRPVWTEVVAHYRRHWYSWVVALLGILLVDTCFMLGLNLTHSLPQKVFITSKLEKHFERGDYLTFRWHGGGPYGAGHRFTKIVKGLPGDVVTWQGRQVFVNGKPVAEAKTRSLTGVPLERGPEGVIPEGHYFVYGSDVNSLDSRYAITGWIDERAVIGKAYGFF